MATGTAAFITGASVQSVAGAGAGPFLVTVGGYSLSPSASAASAAGGALSLRATLGAGAVQDVAGNMLVVAGPAVAVVVGQSS